MNDLTQESKLSLELLLANFEKELHRNLNSDGVRKTEMDPGRVRDIRKQICQIKTVLVDLKSQIKAKIENYIIQIRDLKAKVNSLIINTKLNSNQIEEIRILKKIHGNEILCYENQIKELKRKIVDTSFQSSPATFNSQYLSKKLQEAEKEIERLKLKIYEVEIGRTTKFS